APLSLSYAQCAAWPECVSLGSALADSVRAALRTLGGGTADLLIVGGIGSLWPFVEKIAAALGPVWCSGAAGDDVAVGATWCGELCEYASGALITASTSTTQQTGESSLPRRTTPIRCCVRSPLLAGRKSRGSLPRPCLMS